MSFSIDGICMLLKCRNLKTNWCWYVAWKFSLKQNAYFFWINLILLVEKKIMPIPDTKSSLLLISSKVVQNSENNFYVHNRTHRQTYTQTHIHTGIISTDWYYWGHLLHKPTMVRFKPKFEHISIYSRLIKSYRKPNNNPLLLYWNKYSYL